MSDLVWVTPIGNLGIFPCGTPLNIQLVATSSASNITYSLLNGSLPKGIDSDYVYLTTTGLIVGTPKNIDTQKDYTFTVRAFDGLGNLRDRTFTITLIKTSGIFISTPDGSLTTTFDSNYVDIQLEVSKPVENASYVINLSAGRLPEGLHLGSLGRITGYPNPPINILGFPSTETYNFSVQLTSNLGIDTKNYSITVKNQNLVNPPNTRRPVILNNKPLMSPVPINDVYYGYYTESTNLLPNAKSGEYYSFKIIGHDFENQNLIYNFGVMPPGLTGNPTTGWINGIPTITSNSIADYEITVQVSKAIDTSISSTIQTYYLTITNEVFKDVVWETDPDLGTVDNGSISDLFVKANSERYLEYILIDGNLPPNITLTNSGMLIGRFPFQPQLRLQGVGSISTFTFTIKAYNPQFAVVNNSRTFTVGIKQTNSYPSDNIYFKAYPDLEGKSILQTLLQNTTLIPNEYLYRQNDPYYGKASDVRVIHIYGIESINTNTYLTAIEKSHYNRKLVLGEIKTAVARDDNNNIIYEVVYAEVLDDLVNKNNESISYQIIWPRKISLDNGPFYVSNPEIYTSSGDVYNSYSPGYVRDLYPASLPNMKRELLSTIRQNTSEKLLPKWMTSQQSDGNTLGFISAWVICYTKPGYSNTVKNNISNNWNYSLNIIDFSIDRFIVDRSATYDYDTNLVIPTWTQLPGATPTPDPIDQYDSPVLFPRETILPEAKD